MAGPTIVLLDNGSLRPAATQNLRAVTLALTARVKRSVVPVSLLHSNKIAATDLDGQPAATLEPWLVEQAQAGQRDFLIVPYFIGPSDALTAYVPERMAGLRRRWPDLAVRIAPPLLDPQDPGDERMIDVVEERVRRVLAVLPAAPTQAAVALVDHGSPQPKVTALRNFVAERLQRRLGASVRAVAACSMERREGARYAFGDPLLAALLETPEFSSGPVIVAMLFLSPGRHAGPEGDVARLCRGAEERHPDLRTTMTELLGVHPKLVEILADRIERVLD